MKIKIQIILLLIVMTNCQTPKTNNEQRKAIFLTKEEKEFVLMEMRELLKALHYIHVGLSNENYEFAYQFSKESRYEYGWNKILRNI